MPASGKGAIPMSSHFIPTTVVSRITISTHSTLLARPSGRPMPRALSSILRSVAQAWEAMGTQTVQMLQVLGCTFSKEGALDGVYQKERCSSGREWEAASRGSHVCRGRKYESHSTFRHNRDQERGRSGKLAGDESGNGGGKQQRKGRSMFRGEVDRIPAGCSGGGREQGVKDALGFQPEPLGGAWEDRGADLYHTNTPPGTDPRMVRTVRAWRLQGQLTDEK